MGFRRRINASLQSQNHVHTPTSAGVCTCYVLEGGPAIVSVMIAKMRRACWPPPVCFWRGSERRFGGYGPYHTGFDESGWVTFSFYREQFCYSRELYYHRRWEESLKVFERFLGEGHV